MKYQRLFSFQNMLKYTLPNVCKKYLESLNPSKIREKSRISKNMRRIGIQKYIKIYTSKILEKNICNPKIFKKFIKTFKSKLLVKIYQKSETNVLPRYFVNNQSQTSVKKYLESQIPTKFMKKFLKILLKILIKICEKLMII